MRIFRNVFKNSLETGVTTVTATFARPGGRIEATLTDNASVVAPATLLPPLAGGLTSKATGTGLGLRICCHVVTAHGRNFDPVCNISSQG